MPELDQNRIKVFSKVSGKKGTILVDKFEPRLYIPLDDDALLPMVVKQKLNTFNKAVLGPTIIPPDLLGGEAPQIIGTIGGGIVGGLAAGPPGAIVGAGIGGAAGKAVSEATAEIRGEQPPKGELERLKTLGIAGAESAGAEFLGQFAVKTGVKLFSKAGKLVGRTTEIVEGLPKGAISTLIEEPAKVLGIAKGKIPFSNVVSRTKEAILAYGKKVSDVFEEGLKVIKQKYPTFQFKGKDAIGSINDELKTLGFVDDAGKANFSLGALDSTQQAGLKNAYNLIEKAKGNLDELRILKQRLNNFYKSGIDNRQYNMILTRMKNQIDDMAGFPDELKELNKFYSDKIDNFNKLSYSFDPKDASNAVNKAESALSQLLGKQAGAANERAATRALLDELRNATGVDILDEIKIFEAGRAFGKPFPTSIPTVIGLGQAAARKVTAPIVGKASQIKAALPESVVRTLREGLRGLSDVAALQFIKEFTKE